MSDKLVKASPVGGPVAPAAFDGGAFDEGEPAGLDLRELLSALRRHLWIVLLLGAAGAGGTYYLLSREQTQYRAGALIRLRDVQAEVAGNVLGEQQAATRATKGADPFLSEMMVLKGRQLASAVVDREGLRLFDLARSAPATVAEDVEVTLPADSAAQVVLAFGSTEVTATMGARRVRAPYGAPVELDGVRFTVPAPAPVEQLPLVVLPREGAVDWLLSVVAARPSEGTDAITVAVATPSPDMSVRLTNAVVEEYQAANAVRARELNRRRREFLEARLQETDDSLVAAQTALGRFRNRAGIIGSAAQTAAAGAGATGADMQRKQLQAEQRIRRAQLAEMERAERPTQTAAFRALLASSDVTSNPMVSQLYGRLSELETKRDELLAAGRPATHEDVRQLQNLVTSTEARLVEAMRSQVGALDARIAALGDVREQATAEISRLAPAEAEEVRLGEQVEALRAVGNQLRGELQRARLAEAVEMGQVEIVDRATRALPLSSNRGLKLALGLAFGLFLGAAVAFIREHLNTSIHRRIEVERTLRVPGLVVIPRLGGARKGRLLPGKGKGAAPARARGAARGAGPAVLPELVTVANVKDSAAEAYRALRTRLLFAHSGSALRSVTVTSASVAEGKTTTAANLAVTLAQQGMRVLLVDCDLRRPRLHTMFGVGNQTGLADLLLQRVAPEEAIQATGVDGLSLLASGGVPAGPLGPSELLGGTQMAALLDGAARDFDIAVLDTPPVLLAPDAPILAARTDATLLVLRAGKTGRALAQDAMQQLAAVGANVIGAVLNDPDAKTSKYREYSYQYGYYASV